MEDLTESTGLKSGLRLPQRKKKPCLCRGAPSCRDPACVSSWFCSPLWTPTETCQEAHFMLHFSYSCHHPAAQDSRSPSRFSRTPPGCWWTSSLPPRSGADATPDRTSTASPAAPTADFQDLEHSSLRCCQPIPPLSGQEAARGQRPGSHLPSVESHASLGVSICGYKGLTFPWAKLKGDAFLLRWSGHLLSLLGC